MNMHGGVADIAKKGTNVQNDLLRASLEQAFVEFKNKFPIITVSKARKDKIVAGLEVVVHAMQNGAINGPKLKVASEQCGQHTSVEPAFKFPGSQKTTIDTRKIMSLCTTKMTTDQLVTFELHLPELVENCLQNGRSSDALMDSFGIVKPESHVEQEQLFISRQNLFFLYT